MKKTAICLISLSLSASLLAACDGGNSQSKSQVKTENVKTAETSAENKTEKYINQAVQNIKDRWPYMNKLWPNMDYTRHNLVLFEVDKNFKPKSAWVINTEEKRSLSKEEMSKIEAPMAGGFAPIEFDGKPSIVISINDDFLAGAGSDPLKENFIYTFATHELVHFYYQPEEVTNAKQEEENNRSVKYPLDYKPRLYRKMLMENLSMAAEEKDDKKATEYLGKAKYWNEKWKKEYADEAKAIKLTDIYEGQARYIEYLGEIVSNDISREKMNERIQKDMYFSSVDGESYELGYVSGLLLDRLKADWKKDYFSNEKTPVDMLLENQSIIENEADVNIENEVKKGIKVQNKEVKKDLQNIIKAEGDKSIPYLKVNPKYLNGGMGLEGFYNYNNQTVNSKMECVFKAGDMDLKIKGISTISSTEKDGSYLIIPLVDKFDFKNNTITFNEENISGSLKVQKETDKDGRVLYILR